jgi:uncharacterized protein YwqG
MKDDSDDVGLDSDYLDRVFRDAGLDAEREKLRPFDRNCIVMMAGERTDDVPVGASKLGGDPDLPEDAEWPLGGDGAPLTLVAQVDLAGTHPFDLAGEMPDSGFLWVFYDVRDQPWGFEPEHQYEHRVIYADCGADDLRRRVHPVDDRVLKYEMMATGDMVQRPLRFASRTELPGILPTDTVDGGGTEALNELLWDWGEGPSVSPDYFPVWHSNSEDGQGAPHKLLGYSNLEQENLDRTCAVIAQGLRPDAEMTPENGFTPDTVAEIRGDAPHWCQLFQFHSQGPMYWGAEGAVYVWIRDTDLADRRFDRTQLHLQCT